VEYGPSLADVDLLGNNGIFIRKLKQSNSRVNTDVREIIAMQKLISTSLSIAPGIPLPLIHSFLVLAWK
jgi:hypothetical protein